MKCSKSGQEIGKRPRKGEINVSSKAERSKNGSCLRKKIVKTKKKRGNCQP
jgi:hypothetical protein